MVFNFTFNNISAISWRRVLKEEENGVRGENHRPAASHCQTSSHNVVSSTLRRNEIRKYLASIQNSVRYLIRYASLRNKTAFANAIVISQVFYNQMLPKNYSLFCGQHTLKSKSTYIVPNKYCGLVGGLWCITPRSTIV
jgi:hypothetical protein